MLIVFTLELNLLLPCFGLSALYSGIYCNRWPSPPAWHPSTVVLAWYCTAGVRYRFNLMEEAAPPFLLLSCCTYSMTSTVQHTDYHSLYSSLLAFSMQNTASLSLQNMASLSYRLASSVDLIHMTGFVCTAHYKPFFVQRTASLSLHSVHCVQQTANLLRLTTTCLHRTAHC